MYDRCSTGQVELMLPQNFAKGIRRYKQQGTKADHARTHKINNSCIFAGPRFVKSSTYASKIDHFRLILLLLRVANHQYCAMLLHSPKPNFPSFNPTRLAHSCAPPQGSCLGSSPHRRENLGTAGGLEIDFSRIQPPRPPKNL